MCNLVSGKYTPNMNNGHKIAILMATYNGEEFLEEQLKSILWQDFKDWELFFHDDKSKDDTLKIIDKYVRHYPGKMHLLVDDAENGRGAKDSFMWLLEHVESEYYMFSDQDDIWLPHKISTVYNRIREEESKSPSLPLMVYTDLCVADRYGTPVRLSSYEMAKMRPKWFDSFNAYRVMCKCAGCTTIINHRAKECAIPIHPFAFMHDWWIALMVWKNGGRCMSMDVSTILYRQHGRNECGAPEYGRVNWWQNKIRHISCVYRDNVLLYKFMREVTGCNPWTFVLAKMRVLVYRIFLK